MHQFITASLYILLTCTSIFVIADPLYSAGLPSIHKALEPQYNQPQYVRAQRSLYGEAAPLAFSSHISKEELIALLEAWKEVEEADANAMQTTPAPAPAKAPEPTTRPQAAAAAPAAPPLTLSLPAFVPIQLSAMYAAPVQQAPAAPEAEEPMQEQMEEEQVTAPPPQQQQEAAAPPVSKSSHDSLLRLLSAKFTSGKPASPVLVSPVAKEFLPIPQAPARIIKPVKITRYYPPYEPAIRIIPSAHPAPHYSHGPPQHLELVPSSHLLSNLWR